VQNDVTTPLTHYFHTLYINLNLRLHQSNRRATTGSRIRRSKKINHTSTHHNARRAIRRILHHERIIRLQAELHRLAATIISWCPIERVEEDRRVASIASVLVRVERLATDGDERGLAVRYGGELHCLANLRAEGERLMVADWLPAAGGSGEVCAAEVLDDDAELPGGGHAVRDGWSGGGSAWSPGRGRDCPGLRSRDSC